MNNATEPSRVDTGCAARDVEWCFLHPQYVSKDSKAGGFTTKSGFGGLTRAYGKKRGSVRIHRRISPRSTVF